MARLDITMNFDPPSNNVSVEIPEAREGVRKIYDAISAVYPGTFPPKTFTWEMLDAPDSDARFIRPVEGGWISQHFGENKEIYRGMFGLKNGHNGIDYAVVVGTPVMAAADGKVVKSGYDKNGYGNYLKVKHANGYETLYAHLHKRAVGTIHNVLRGDAIALSGITGFSTGPHLHFEVRKNGVAVDPAPLII